MHDLIHYITHIPAATWYHLAAFILTGAGAQYTVQLVKVISKRKWGKSALRFMNGAVSTILTAIPAIITGGMSLGNIGKTSLALATLSSLIYRVHNSFLYKAAEQIVDDATSTSLNGTTQYYGRRYDAFVDTKDKSGTPASSFAAND